MEKDKNPKTIIGGENLKEITKQIELALEQREKEKDTYIEKNHWTWLINRAKGLLALGFFFMLILFVCSRYDSFEKSGIYPDVVRMETELKLEQIQTDIDAEILKQVKIEKERFTSEKETLLAKEVERLKKQIDQMKSDEIKTFAETRLKLSEIQTKIDKEKLEQATLKRKMEVLK